MHDRRREHGHGTSVADDVATAAPGVGKQTLTQGLMAAPAGQAGPELPGDPVAARVTKVKQAAAEGHVRKALELMGSVGHVEQVEIATAIGA